MKKVIFLTLVGVLFSGCGLLPYKTEYTCPNAIGGSCGNALRSYNSALNDIYGNDNKIDDSEYIHKTECISCQKGE